jgi:hypothetical protein
VHHQQVQTIQVHIKLLVAVLLLQVHVQVAAQIVAAVAVVLAVHSERIRARAASVNRRAEKHCAMNSTICKLHNWVELLFLTVMARLRFVCAAVRHSQISQKKLVQIQQH